MSFRLVFHNPHTNIWFRRPVYFFLTKKRSVDKYTYLLDYCIMNKIDYAFLADGADFSFGRSKFRGKWFAKAELLLWCYLNKIYPGRERILTDVNKLRETDVLFSFLYGNLINVFESNARDKSIIANTFRRTKAYTVVHATHYMYNAEMGGRVTELADVDLFVAENDLATNSKFFQRYYGWYKDKVYHLPFVPKSRFKRKKNFEERKNLAVATGTLPLRMTDLDFLGFFKNGDIHPMRRLIFENKELLMGVVDSYIHDVLEGVSESKVKSNVTGLGRLRSWIYNNFIAKQQNYFSFDIVQLYNDYKMFIVPEEINDLPGIGFVEGMACGTVYIGKRDPMYSDIGMIDGVHYIGYDGTLEDLRNRVTYYQERPTELEQIADNSYDFFLQFFQSGKVSGDFIEFLKKRTSGASHK